MSLAFLIAGAIQQILFEVDAHDPLIFGGVAATLAVVSRPRGATLIDPRVAMRAE